MRWTEEQKLREIRSIVKVIRNGRRSEKRRLGPVPITDEMRSMIAGVLVSSFDSDVPVDECKRRSLCCCGHLNAYRACVSILGGRRGALRLREFIYAELACCGWLDRKSQDAYEQRFLDRISELEEI